MLLTGGIVYVANLTR